jgi:hypothetical protein
METRKVGQHIVGYDVFQEIASQGFIVSQKLANRF